MRIIRISLVSVLKQFHIAFGCTENIDTFVANSRVPPSCTADVLSALTSSINKLLISGCSDHRDNWGLNALICHLLSHKH